MIVDPRADHMRILLVEVSHTGSAVHRHLFVKAIMISFEGLVAPEYHLAPQIGVLTTLVHRSVWLEILLNVELVLLKG